MIYSPILVPQIIFDYEAKKKKENETIFCNTEKNIQKIITSQ